MFLDLFNHLDRSHKDKCDNQDRLHSRLIREHEMRIAHPSHFLDIILMAKKNEDAKERHEAEQWGRKFWLSELEDYYEPAEENSSQSSLSRTFFIRQYVQALLSEEIQFQKQDKHGSMDMDNDEFWKRHWAAIKKSLAFPGEKEQFDVCRR